MKLKFMAAPTLQDHRLGIGWRNAYHQAGHVAAIYLSNRQKQLPPVHFQLSIKLHGHNPQQTGRFPSIYSKYTVKVEGGRLIQSLPASFVEATQNLSWFQQAEYRCAFEADIMNLLTGPLAEAKYIASCDGEPFNANIINLNVLRLYGEGKDINVVNEYMACYMPEGVEREQKLAELFLAAFSFVNDDSNWRKITALAEFIREHPEEGIIHCEDLICMLDSCVTLKETKVLDLQTMELSR